MDFKKKNIVKSLEELELTFHNNVDCNKNPKLCNFSTLLSQTINKTILFLENHNNNTTTNPTNPTNPTNTTNTTYKNNIMGLSSNK